jgi:hypothetical protein
MPSRVTAIHIFYQTSKLEFKMKVLLLSINASWTHSCLPLYYLRNALAGLPHEIQLSELSLKQSQQEALELIYLAQPDILALSVYIWNSAFVAALIPELRKLLPQLKIVIGGPEATHAPDALEKFQPDFLIKGAGESAFNDLARAGFISPQMIISGVPLPLEQIPFPYLDGDLPALQGKLLYYEASRGCAFSCIYCLSSHDTYQDFLPVERAKADIQRLLRFQPKVIKFVDRSFNQRRDWAREIWAFVIALDTKVPFHFEVHPDLLEETDIALLSSAPKGRLQFEIGIQSIHSQTLELIHRPSDWQRVLANLHSLKRRTCIPLHTDLLVGLPGEGSQQLIASLNALLPAFPDELQLGFLKILPGTLMTELARQQHYLWSDQPPYQVMQTDSLSFGEFLHWEKIAAILNLYWNKGDFATVWQQAILWREPYLCMQELLTLSLDSDQQLHSIDRVKRFELMAKWIQSAWQEEQQAYLSDALRWDWCRKASEPWFPAALQGEGCLSFRKEHYTALQDWLKTEYWQQESWNLKRFIVFSATSNAFCLDYLDGYTKAVFISDQGKDNAMVIYTQRY